MMYPMSITFYCRPGDTVYVIDSYISDGRIKYVIFKDTVDSAYVRDSGIYYETTNCCNLTWMETIFPDRSSAIEHATLNNLDFQEAD